MLHMVFIYLSVCFFVCLFVPLFVRLSFWFVWLFVCLFVCLLLWSTYRCFFLHLHHLSSSIHMSSIESLILQSISRSCLCIIIPVDLLTYTPHLASEKSGLLWGPVTCETGVDSLLNFKDGLAYSWCSFFLTHLLLHGYQQKPWCLSRCGWKKKTNVTRFSGGVSSFESSSGNITSNWTIVYIHIYVCICIHIYVENF